MLDSKSLQSAFEDSPGTGNGMASLAFGTDTEDSYVLAPVLEMQLHSGSVVWLVGIIFVPACSFKSISEGSLIGAVMETNADGTRMLHSM